MPGEFHWVVANYFLYIKLFDLAISDGLVKTQIFRHSVIPACARMTEQGSCYEITVID